jgi:anti-anti-sigma factor
MTDPLAFRISTHDSATIVAVAGEVDLTTASQLRHLLTEQRGRVVVDLADVPYLDSSGLAALSDGYRALRRDGGTLVVRAPRPHVRRVLEVTGLAGWIDHDGRTAGEA